MKTVILCGGYGTRIRDLTSDIPKPMIPIANLPILWHIMKYYAQSGFNEFVLCLGYKAETIKRFFLDYESLTTDFTITLGTDREIISHNSHGETNWRITLADTGLNTMTGARVKRVAKYIGDDEDFMLTYGDGLSNIDLTKLFAFHKSHGKLLTVTGVHPPARFGEIEHDADGRVVEFNEKTQTSSGRISGGFFMAKREMLDYLSDDEGCVMEVEPMRNLARDGQLMLYRHDGFWQCMDTMREYQLLNSLWNSGQAPWKTW
ncbi:MAG: glucose-1-phosphate cytidylyltransferase [Pseudomonadota bacterium]